MKKAMKILRRIASMAAVGSPGLRTAIRAGKLRKYFAAKRALRFDGSFRDFISVVAMVRDEADYLAEWIEYHLLVGVSRFYIFDNDSTDGTAEVLRPYIDRGVVVYRRLSDSEIHGRGGVAGKIRRGREVALRALACV